MINLDFLTYINASIHQDENSYYYVFIPAVKPYVNIENSYLENYDNGIYIKLTEDLLNNDDLIYIVTMGTSENYEIISTGGRFTYIGMYTFNKVNSTNYEYYAKINTLLDNNIEEEQILNFYQTFMKFIEYYANVQNIEDIKTQIYQKVIEYYANGQTDCVIRGLSLILNSSVYNYSDTSAYATCGCNSTITTSSTGTTTGTTTSTGLVTNLDCVSAYKESMYLYLIQMLGDIDFYYNFMFIDNEPNEELIDYLINLITLLEEMGFSLNPSTSNNHCLCSELESKNIDNYSILNNYKKVLNWVKNCEIEENTNKIKIYGKQFGELLPSLQF